MLRVDMLQELAKLTGGMPAYRTYEDLAEPITGASGCYF
jgi:hypothetical protein